MKVAVTGVKQVTSKKNNETYTIVSGVSKSGTTVEAFLNAEQVRGATIVAPTNQVLEELFQVLPVLEVEFNEKGRVESISEA